MSAISTMPNKDFTSVKPYTYTLTRKSDGLQYHGVRHGNVRLGLPPLLDLGNKYFSSGIFKSEFKSNPDNFFVKIRWSFPSIESAILHESIVNKKLIHRKNWANIAVGKGCSDVEKLKVRREAAMMKKYNVSHNFMIKSVRDKKDETMINRYGVKNAGSSQVIRKKVIQTSLEKFGVECSFQSESVKEKSKKSLMDRYGVDNPNKSPLIREKIKQTNLKNFGCEHGFQRAEVIQKIKNKRTDMYIKFAKMSEIEFNNYLTSISQNKSVQNQKKSQRLKGIKLLGEQIYG